MNHHIPIEWQRIFNLLADKVTASKFDAWIRPIHVNIEGRALHICAPSRFFLDGLRDSYEETIAELVHREFGEDVTMIYKVDASAAPLPKAASKKPATKVKSNVDGFIDPRFTFENFVIGSNSEFSAAASRAVADNPGKSYNPLYIHGGVGLGKTHLINAIANQVLKNNPDTKVVYRTSERFTNELVTAIRDRTTHQFREQYRRVDLLIIDDIQFIAGKVRTQEEFFHTFNSLYELQKHIILTSDRTPHAISNFEERLKSRFNMGLVTDIQPPDLETRLAILSSKTKLASVDLPEDVAYLLASRITNNVRELEGGLTRLVAHASLTGKPITLEVAQHTLRDLLHEKVRAISIDEIQKHVAQYYNIRIQDLRSTKRTRNIAQPRQVAMYLCKQLTNFSYPEIGQHFERDHTTILHAVKKIEGMKSDNHDFLEEVNRMATAISK
ncbi:MAG: chromosomal replication initiator protein DnaA [Mariprofundaceae bacterium]